ncbi:MAG: hypothetical protein R6V85_17400 [Polyangia bacterium]
MARQRKGSGKRAARRVSRDESAPGKAEKKSQQSTPEDPDKPKISERPKETDSGFGVLKGVAIALIVLILGAGVVSRFIGGDDATRGDKLPGELCDETIECESGSICYSYKKNEKRCWKTCGADESCEPGYTCVSSAEQAGRKSTRVRAVCIEDDKVR